MGTEQLSALEAEFIPFTNTELATFMNNQEDLGVPDYMMKLDLNCDGQLDFQEFLNLIDGLAIAWHEFFLWISQKRI